MIRPSIKLFAPLVAVLLVAAACSGTQTSDETIANVFESADAGALSFEATAEPPADELARAAGDSEAAQGAVSAQDLGRSIIRRASLVVAVTDVEAATAEATRRIQSRGGVLFGQDSVGLPEPTSTVTFRVPPAEFENALAELASLGDLRSQSITADDVTERVVDLESRIATAEASVERLRALILDASDLETITALENQLLERETLLETLRGSLRTIQDQVDLATITATFTEALARPAISLQVTAYPGHEDDGASCPGQPQITVDENAPVTMCFEITNVGDTPLTSFELSDPVLDLEMDDLTVVFGDPAAVLEPGQFVILGAEIAPERTLRTQSRATAVPVDQDGQALEARGVSATTSALVQAVDPGGIPGFGDGVNASWELLGTIADVIVLVAGLAVPFAWIPVAIWLLLRWRRQRKSPPSLPPAPPAPSEPDPQPELIDA